MKRFVCTGLLLMIGATATAMDVDPQVLQNWFDHAAAAEEIPDCVKTEIENLHYVQVPEAEVQKAMNQVALASAIRNRDCKAIGEAYWQGAEFDAEAETVLQRHRDMDVARQIIYYYTAKSAPAVKRAMGPMGELL